MRLKEFFVICNYAGCDFQEEIQKAKRPEKVGGIRTPSTLNDLTMGELMQLQGIKTEREMILVPCRVLLGLDERKVRCACVRILGSTGSGTYKQTVRFY